MKRRDSLRWRLIFPLLTLWALAGAAILAFAFQQASALANQQLRQRAEDLLAAVTHAQDIADRAGGLQRFVTAIGAEQDVAGIMVLRTAPARILASTWREGVGRSLEAIADRPVQLTPLVERLQGRVHGWACIAPGRWCLTAPLIGTATPGAAIAKTEGALGVILDGSGAGRQLTWAFLLPALGGVSLLVVLLALSLSLVDRLLLRPLRELSSAVQEEGGQGWKRLPSLHGPNEIGTLAMVFQKTIERLSLMRQAVDAAANGVVVLDALQPGAPIIHANPAFVRHTDESASELSNHASGFARVTGSEAQVAMERVLATGAGCRLRLHHERADGSAFWGELQLSPIRDDAGQVVRIIGILNDLTDMFALQERLIESENRHRLLIERLPEAVVIQAEGVIRFANETAVRMMRQSGHQDLEGLSLLDLVHADDRVNVERLVGLTGGPATSEAPVSILARFIIKDQALPVEILAVMVPWKGTPSLCAIIRDVGERQRIENALIRARNQTQKLFDEIPNPIWRVDQDGRLTYVNQAWVLLTGRSLTQELIAGRLHYIHDDERSQIEETFANALRDRAPYTVSYRLQRADGAWAWITERGIPCQDLDGQGIGFMGSCYDITEIQQASLRFAEAHAESELLLSTISAALVGIDTKDRITRWNTTAERIFGIPASEALGRTLAESGIRLDWAEVFLGINDCITNGRAVELHDLRFQRPDGRDGFLFLAINSSWSTTGDGNHRLGVVLLATDTTERRLAESQHQQGAKLESIGQLAAGIAHEINTPIQFIGDNLRFMADAARDQARLDAACQPLLEAARAAASADQVAAHAAVVAATDPAFLAEEVPKAIAQSLEGVERVAAIVKAMKDFAHPDQGAKKPEDLNRIISTTLIVARNEYKYLAELVTELAPDLPPVPCQAGEMKQVVLNLVVNAAHAIGDVIKGTERRGVITVATRAEAGWAELRIADTGSGIPEAVRERIFEPFFTTKEVGRGTGQGLYIARTVVEKKHGGTIRFETELGKGTTFIIRLPLTPGGGA